LSRVLQGKLNRDGAAVELTEEKSSVALYSPNSNDVSTGNDKSPLLEAVVRERQLKLQQAGKRLSSCCGDL
jgi:hypothetical protein